MSQEETNAEQEEHQAYTMKEFTEYIHSLDLIDVLVKCEAINEDEVVGRKISCPFHDEKTPSLNLYEDHYYCFGCAENGDAFTFVQKSYDLSFPQACEFIAEAYDCELEIGSGHVNPFKKKVSTTSLENEWKSYLAQMESAPEDTKKGADIFFPLEVGYDKNMDYYVFRYTSKTGKTLGFTKRRAFELKEDDPEKPKKPKWKHSSLEKSNISACANAYNLGAAIKHIRNTKHVILVEGVKDCIPFILEGQKEVISISGTHHFDKVRELLPEDLERYTLALDGDGAGHKGMVDIVTALAGEVSLDSIDYVDVNGYDPYDYHKENEELPEPKEIYELFDDEELKLLYAYSSAYNQEKLVSYVFNRDKLSWRQAESFFSMGEQPKDKKDKKESELDILMKSNDPAAKEKLRIKYGIV